MAAGGFERAAGAVAAGAASAVGAAVWLVLEVAEVLWGKSGTHALTKDASMQMRKT